jgi:hypothetical protein
MAGRAGAQAYDNHDLKAHDETARKATVRFAFEFPGLLQLFEQADAASNRARRRNRRYGVTGVLLVLISLLYASAAPLLPHGHHGGLALAGYIAAGLGLLGAVLGFAGLSRSSQRQRWLRGRVQTETLRLFHFHYLAARAPEIVAAGHDPRLQEAYIEARQRALDELLAAQLGDLDGALRRIVHPPTLDPFGHVQPQKGQGGISDAAREVFAAWRQLRLQWQLRYCEAKLAATGTGGRRSPRQQEKLFSLVSWACVGGIVLLHLAYFAQVFVHLPLVWLEITVIWTALIALAVRALEDGLKPQREVERYEQYRANIKVACQRFDAAADMETRLEVMRAFEQVSLEEMHVFIRSHADARFLL